MGTRGERQDMGTQDWHFSPLPKGTSRAIHHPKAEGGWALWRASRGRVWGRKASRAAMVDPGTRAGMAGQGTRVDIAGRRTRAAMVDPGTREAMAGQGTGAAIASPPPRTWPQPLPRPLRLEPFYPQRKILGGSWGWFGLALGRRGHLGALWRCGHLRTVPRSGLWRERRHSKLI